MITQLRYLTLVVSDQGEALRWYTEKLGLEKRMDMPNGSSRWITVGIKGQPYPEIILQKPSLQEHGPQGLEKKLGQIGQNPTWVLLVDDCPQTVETLRGKGVKILEEPQDAGWAIAALIEDLYGNAFTLAQPK